MVSYVLLGAGNLIGEFVDIIHLNGGRLAKVVLNVPERAHPRRLSLRERLARLPYPVEVQRIEEFRPAAGMRHAVGFTGAKMRPLVERLRAEFGISFASLVHPAAVLSPTVAVPEGAVINAGVVVASHAFLGRHVVLNRRAAVGHDTRVGDYAVIQPGANVAGHVTVGEGAFIGMGANVLEDRILGRGCLVAAGSVVLDDVAEYTMVAGVPASVKKTLARDV